MGQREEGRDGIRGKSRAKLVARSGMGFLVRETRDGRSTSDGSRQPCPFVSFLVPAFSSNLLRMRDG